MPYYSGEERLPDEVVRRVLVVMAHPDDADFVAAGSVARWAREGAECVYLLCTDGNKGSDDPAMTPER
ncbi:MAG TPA: PIG-L family deacetylase, partial [Chloroflexota bacterium]|nr:PIG-L family deacetylase [Chloroflexota bacterium]